MRDVSPNSRSSAFPGSPECRRARRQLCRMAAGVEVDGRRLARHARRCPGCLRFADELARVRRVLDTTARPLAVIAAPAELLEDQAWAAVARELRARLARDLLAMGTGGRPRDLAKRRADVQRLAALDMPLAPSVQKALLGPAKRWHRLTTLGLAVSLDPLGLDIALPYLAALVRSGRSDEADREADRLLALVGRSPSLSEER